MIWSTNLADQQGGEQWRKQVSRVAIDTGDSGVFVTCDMGREGKCMAEAVDVFSQVGRY